MIPGMWNSMTHPRAHGISNNTFATIESPQQYVCIQLLWHNLPKNKDMHRYFRTEYTKYSTRISIDTYARCVLGNASVAAAARSTTTTWPCSSDNKRRSKQRTSFHFHSHQERCKNDLTVNRVLITAVSKFHAHRRKLSRSIISSLNA